jgi:hypothetical protein
VEVTVEFGSRVTSTNPWAAGGDDADAHPELIIPQSTIRTQILDNLRSRTFIDDFFSPLYIWDAFHVGLLLLH